MKFVDSSTPKYEWLLFDLDDDNLYPLSSGLSEACANKTIVSEEKTLKKYSNYSCTEFMVKKLGIDEDGVVEPYQLFGRKYGTVMAGLKAVGYEFDNDEYHNYIHQRLSYQNIKPNPVLRNLLLGLPFRKLVFSNGDEIHVMKILKRFGIENCFERIICFETVRMNFLTFPKSRLLVNEPRLVLRNPLTLHRSILTKTLFEVDKSEKMDGSYHTLESIHKIKETFSELWSEFSNNKEENLNTLVAPIETSVQA